MKQLSRFLMILTLCLFCAVTAFSASEYAATPIEREDVNTVGEIDQGDSNVFEATPTEQEDSNSIGEIDRGDSNVFNATPTEQGDINTINQINNQ